jgi:signal transduction histidine kinase
MRDEAHRVKAIVSQLLNYSKPHSGKPVRCDLKALNEEILIFLYPDKKPSGANFHVEYAPGLPAIWADSGQIKQALLNLYLNAREAAGNEGRVEARFAPASDGSRIAISITDNGPGLSDEDLSRAFEPYYTKRQGGTGLGLMVTRRIIEAHGGEIGLERREPQGTVAKIVLPVGK